MVSPRQGMCDPASARTKMICLIFGGSAGDHERKESRWAPSVPPEFFDPPWNSGLGKRRGTVRMKDLISRSAGQYGRGLR